MPKPGNPAVAPAALLLAEIERLKADLIQAEGKIADLEARADVDPLLNILNRRGFARELARSLAYVKRYGTPAVLMFIDLDGFKAVNDQHGHAAGDVLLKAVAAELDRPCAGVRRGGAARRRRIRRADVASGRGAGCNQGARSGKHDCADRRQPRHCAPDRRRQCRRRAAAAGPERGADSRCRRPRHVCEEKGAARLGRDP